MIAKMTNRGVDANGKPILDIDFQKDSFIDAKTEKSENGYRAELTFAKKDISDEDAAKAAAGIDEIIARTAKEQDEARITEEEDQTENNTEKEGIEDGKID